MLPSLARLTPTGAPLPLAKLIIQLDFSASTERVTMTEDRVGTVGNGQVLELLDWARGAFGGSGMEWGMTRDEFVMATKKIVCTEDTTTFSDRPYTLERVNQTLMDTHGSQQVVFMFAIGWESRFRL